MPAAATDKLKKATPRYESTITGPLTSTDTTIPILNPSGLATDTAVLLYLDAADSTKREAVIGVLSGSNLINCIRGVEGSAQTHASGATISDWVTARHWNDMVDWALAEHNQDGSHKAGGVTTTSLADGSVTSAKIADGTIATIDIADGAVTAPKIVNDGSILRGSHASGPQTPHKVRLPFEIGSTYSADTALSGVTGASKGTGPLVVPNSWLYVDPTELTVTGKTAKARLLVKLNRTATDTIFYNIFKADPATRLVAISTAGTAPTGATHNLTSTALASISSGTEVLLRSDEFDIATVFGASAALYYLEQHNQTSTANRMIVNAAYLEVYWV